MYKKLDLNNAKKITDYLTNAVVPALIGANLIGIVDLINSLETVKEEPSGPEKINNSIDNPNEK